jgi:hypothetical protein
MAFEKLYPFLHVILENFVFSEVFVVIGKTTAILALLLPQGLSEWPLKC